MAHLQVAFVETGAQRVAERHTLGRRPGGRGLLAVGPARLGAGRRAVCRIHLGINQSLAAVRAARATSGGWEGGCIRGDGGEGRVRERGASNEPGGLMVVLPVAAQ